MAKAKREPIKYGTSDEYKADVKSGKIIPRTISKISDERKEDLKRGAIIPRPGDRDTHLDKSDFSYNSILTNAGTIDKQEYIARRYYEANIDNINNNRKKKGLSELTVDQAVAASKAIYEVLNNKGKSGDFRKKDIESGKLVPRPGEILDELSKASSSVPPSVTHNITFKADSFSLVDGEAQIIKTVAGSVDPISLSSLEFPAVTIKSEHESTKKVDDNKKWIVTGATTGIHTETEIKAMSINGDITLTAVTVGK